MKKDCLFCLKNNLLKTKPLYQDNNTFIILPASASEAYLIIPMQHVEKLQDLPDNWWKHLKKALTALQLNTASYNLAVNYGKDAGQSVKHLHFWVIPRQAGQSSSGMGLARLISKVNDD